MILEFKNVKKEYSDSNFKLEDLSFQLSKNEVLGIIGKNGTGKSTILKMANRLVEIDNGDIIYQGKSILSMSENELRNFRKEVVYIFQNSNLLENKTVYYHLKLIYKLNKIKVDEKEIDNILDFMEIKRLKNSYCNQLSGGQKQKVAIAMAILQKPKILLCDEISSALDQDAEREVYELLQKIIKQSEVSIIMISHNLSVLKNFCDRVLYIEKGNVFDIIEPKKTKVEYEDDYYQNVLEVLNAWFTNSKQRRDI